MTLGEKLKKLRTDKGLTQKDLAEQLHVTFQTVSKWESDINEPDVNTLKELSKFYDCSLDSLLGDEEVKKVEEVVQPKEEVASPKLSIHTCPRCKKQIPEDQLMIHRAVVAYHGRSHTPEYMNVYYDNKCYHEMKKEEEAKERQEKLDHAKKIKKRSFGWGIVAGIVSLAIALIVLLNQQVGVGLSILYSVLIGYALFADLYCILSESYISDVFVTIATWSIRFPGVIFSLDLGGIFFLIAVKVLFAIIGFFIGVAAFILSVIITAVLSAVSFPFVLVHNSRNLYSDAAD